MVKRQSRSFCKQVMIGVTLILLVTMFATAGAAARTLSVTAPNGGEWYEPGEAIQIQWSAAGTDWQSSDTIKIEYTTDNGINWNAIQNAKRLPYNSGSYSWDTSGIASSGTCYARVTSNNDKNVYDTSNTSFTLMADTIAPIITHTPLSEMGGNAGPYPVSAIVTDNRGVANVKLFWSRNSSEFQPLTMVPTGVPNEFSASIPGPSEHCDYYRYYIEARDSSSSSNISRSPTSGSASPNYFGISSPPSTETVSGANSSTTQSAYMCGNRYISQQTTILTEFQQYLSLPVSTELRFFVYTYQENPQNTWKYVKTFETTVAGSGTGLGWYSSGPVSIRLDQGQEYWIGCAWRDSGTFYYGQSTNIAVSFGKADCKYELASYPPPISPASGAGMLGPLSYQRLTTFPASRGLAIDEPYQHKFYEPGDDLVIRWHPTGECWQNGDMVRLQYTSNNGASWTQIAGAENLPYVSGSFTWNTTGAPWPSSYYRVRAVWNTSDAVSDISDDNFYLDIDTWPPSINHTAIANTTNRFGPYVVKASIYEGHHDGLADATVYWSRNGSEFVAAPMVLTSGDAYYVGNIPGLSSAGDIYSYYIVARDASQAHNTTRSPATGTYQFCILPTPPEYFTEEFNTYSNIFDLQHMSILFTPDGSSSYYSASVNPIAALPTDPEGGRVVQISDDGCEIITIDGAAQVSLYGMTRNNVWVSTEGYITLDQGWWNWWMSTEEHFDYKQVAAYCRNLNPSPGSITYKQLSDRIAVTYFKVPSQYDSVPNTFQIEMFFDGRIRLSYLDMDSQDAIVGLSRGTDLPADFVSSDLSNYQPPRGIALVYPNGGDWIEPGETLPISWHPSGPYWNSSDTISLDLSTDGGTTWIPIPGASNLPWNQNSFSLDTSSLLPSEHYRFRVTADNDGSITDALDADVTLALDTESPIINHNPLAYSGDFTGPYRVRAQVTDNQAIASVTLYWNKNGGPFTPVAISPADFAGEYAADIPGPSVLGDKYCYYIEACDTASTANVTRSPSGAPAEAHSLTLFPAVVDTLGNSSMYLSPGNHFTSNIYECTHDSWLTQIEHYLNVDATTDIFYVVYESTSLASTYSKIAQVVTKGVSPGIKLCSSGPMSVHLAAGRCYLIGEVHTSAGYYVNTESPNPVSVNFGQFRGSYFDYVCYPEPEYTVNTSTSTFAYYQRLTTCPAQRNINLTTPNGGQWYEPGEAVTIQWQPIPSTWTPLDTIRLEYSTDSGSTWQTIPGAASLPYNAGSYSWVTGETIASEHCRVRALMNGYDVCNDASDADFSITHDSIPPVIVHTPLTDQAKLSGPYNVTASITDNYGVAGAILYCSKNGGSFAAVPMILTTTPNTYTADIPGPSVIGDRYCYYIEATDTSIAHNVGIEPASAPEELNCFNVVSCGTDAVGVPYITYFTSYKLFGNLCQCTTESVITGIEQYLDPTGSSEMRFAVYESTSISGTYTKIHETVISNPAQGEGWYSSGPIHVQMLAGRYYAICAATPNNAKWFSNYNLDNQATLFGKLVYACYSTTYPPYQSASFSTIYDTATQRLSTCRVARALDIYSPNGGQWYEVGNLISIQWNTTGLCWQPTDTVRLEFSSNGGVTWSPITGAENLAFNTGTFSWDTTGCAQSTQYRVRCVFNGDDAVTDVSNADFKIMPDTVPPVITHTPLSNTSPNPTSSYYMNATVTDNYKVGTVTVYWSKNGGGFTAAPMSGSYYCYLPRTGQIGDVYRYYIEARDASSGANMTRLPASGCYEYGLVDWLTESFGGKRNPSLFIDLAGTSITFTPDGSKSFYSAYTKPILSLPIDPAGGTPLTLTDDSFAQCMLTGGKQVSIFGSQYGSFFVGSNGYITFDAGDTSLVHFQVKRISGLLANLNPAAGGSVSWKQLADRVVVTYQDVPEVSSGYLNTFQIEMFFDGRITLSYMRVDADFATCGLSAGPIPAAATVSYSNLSTYPLCCTAAVQIGDSTQPAGDAIVEFGHLPVGSSRMETVTITNTSTCDAILKEVGSQLKEDFSDGMAQGWLEQKDINWNVIAVEYQCRGSVYYTYYEMSPVAWYATLPFGDFHYQVRLRHDQNSTVPSYIWFRCAAAESRYSPLSGYFMTIDTYYRRFQVSKYVNGISTTLTNLTTSTAIASGTTPNTVAIDAIGPNLTFYINGTKVCTLTDTTYTSGYVGISSGSSYSNGYTFWFDDIICNPIINGLQADSDSFHISGLPNLPIVLGPGQSINAQVTYTPGNAGASIAKLMISTRGTSTLNTELLLKGAGISTDTAVRLRASADGSPVGISDRHVTAVFGDRFYIEDADRSGGICVLWGGAMPAVGNHVTVIGEMTTIDGERAVRASQVYN